MMTSDSLFAGFYFFGGRSFGPLDPCARKLRLSARVMGSVCRFLILPSRIGKSFNQPSMKQYVDIRCVRLYKFAINRKLLSTGGTLKCADPYIRRSRGAWKRKLNQSLSRSRSLYFRGKGKANVFPTPVCLTSDLSGCHRYFSADWTLFARSAGWGERESNVNMAFRVPQTSSSSNAARRRSASEVCKSDFPNRFWRPLLYTTTGGFIMETNIWTTPATNYDRERWTTTTTSVVRFCRGETTRSRSWTRIYCPPFILVCSRSWSPVLVVFAPIKLFGTYKAGKKNGH